MHVHMLSHVSASAAQSGNYVGANLLLYIAVDQNSKKLYQMILLLIQ
jgi:hypothetical protein